MRSLNRPVYVYGSARIPFAKSQTAYADVLRKELMAAALAGLVQRHGLHGQRIGDVSLGAVMNSVADFNLAREVVLSTELHPETPGYNVQRACGTGLETVWQIALKIHTGAIDTGIAGGVDTNSDLPIEASAGLRTALMRLQRAKILSDRVGALTSLTLADLRPKVPNVNEPRTGLSMGEHCERMVQKWGIGRAEQDAFA